MRELLLRINALIKRNKQNSAANTDNPTLIFDDIALNDATKKVFWQND